MHKHTFRNGYGLFTSELLATLTDIPSQQRMQEVSVRWKNATQAVRDKYNKIAHQVNM